MSDESTTTWEYRVVWLELRQVMIGDVHQNIANIDKELNSVGAKGWELVFVQEVGGGKLGGGYAYIFKRQVVKERETKGTPESVQPIARTTQAQRSPKIDWDSKW